MQGFAAIAIVSVAGGVAAAQPAVRIDVPKHTAAWDDARVRIAIRAEPGTGIVPLAVELEAPGGTVMAWGLEGECHGGERGCSIEGNWAHAAPARRRGGGWELWVDGPPSQVVRSPDALEREATEQLVGAAPAAWFALDTRVLASYAHAGTLTVTLRYAVVDPKAIALCAPRTPPSERGFLACVPSSASADEVYAPRAEWDRIARMVSARAELVVDHPAFDLDAARARAKMASGRVGYVRARQEWILVDDPGGRTVIVGATGAPRELPGDWIEQLLALERGESVTVYWYADKPEWPHVKARVDAVPFVFKGHEDPHRLIVTLEPANVLTLASAVRHLGYHMTPDGIVK